MNDESSSALVKASAEAALEFLKAIALAPAQELSGILCDSLRLWRFKNQVRILIKAKEYTEQQKIHIHKVPMKVLAPFLDGCSLEDDERLQELWASLLASELQQSDDITKTLIPSYVAILGQLSRLDAELLAELYDTQTTCRSITFKNPDQPEDWYRSSGLDKEKLCESMHDSFDRVKVVLDRLLMLRLVEPVEIDDLDKFGSNEYLVMRRDYIRLSHMGYDFCTKCMHSKPQQEGRAYPPPAARLLQGKRRATGSGSAHP